MFNVSFTRYADKGVFFYHLKCFLAQRFGMSQPSMLAALDFRSVHMFLYPYNAFNSIFCSDLNILHNHVVKHWFSIDAVANFGYVSKV